MKDCVRNSVSSRKAATHTNKAPQDCGALFLWAMRPRDNPAYDTKTSADKQHAPMPYRIVPKNLLIPKPDTHAPKFGTHVPDFGISNSIFLERQVLFLAQARNGKTACRQGNFRNAFFSIKLHISLYQVKDGSLCGQLVIVRPGKQRGGVDAHGVAQLEDCLDCKNSFRWLQVDRKN